MPCAQSRLFSTASSHGSQGPEFRTPDAVLNGSCMPLWVGGLQGCSRDKQRNNACCARAVRKRPQRMWFVVLCRCRKGQYGWLNVGVAVLPCALVCTLACCFALSCSEGSGWLMPNVCPVVHAARCHGPVQTRRPRVSALLSPRTRTRPVFGQGGRGTGGARSGGPAGVGLAE